MRKILVCLDGSRLSEHILPYVREEAVSDGSEIVLLQVVSITGMVVSPPPAFHSVAVLIDRFIKEQLTQAQAYLERLAEPFRKAGLEVKCVVSAGSIAATITGYARKNNVDCIALPGHGWKWLNHLISGSIAKTVIQETRQPILLIKPGPAGDIHCEKLRFRESDWGTRLKELVSTGKALF